MSRSHVTRSSSAINQQERLVCLTLLNPSLDPTCEVSSLGCPSAACFSGLCTVLDTCHTTLRILRLCPQVSHLSGNVPTRNVGDPALTDCRLLNRQLVRQHALPWTFPTANTYATVRERLVSSDPCKLCDSAWNITHPVSPIYGCD